MVDVICLSDYVSGLNSLSMRTFDQLLQAEAGILVEDFELPRERKVLFDNDKSLWFTASRIAPMS